MAVVYQYWQHRATGEVWAVKLRDGRVVGAADMSPTDVNPELLPYLPYCAAEAATLEGQRREFRRIGGRRAA